ncbi:hypothetical protein AB0N31_29390 [Streptomyces sp. NPDC051051]|uniref:hypothetical protein n=1 Tax=Streptomyces sp. NPDC051051 TaxID=3155666 RepID=UPI00343E65D2
MQDPVDAVRSTGADHAILAGGAACSDDLGRWLTYGPADPTGDLAARHVHTFDSRADEGRWNSPRAPAADRAPSVRPRPRTTTGHPPRTASGCVITCAP